MLASAALTILANSRRAGSLRLYFFMTESKLTYCFPFSSKWYSSAPGESKGIAPSDFATSRTLSFGTNRNSGFLSTNLDMTQGHAIRSTLAFSLVTTLGHK